MAVTPFRLAIGKSRGSQLGGKKGEFYAGQASDDFNEIVKYFTQFVGHMKEQVPEIFEEVMRPTFEKSQIYCPKKGGDLRASGYLEIRSFRDGTRAEMGYGRGGFPEYAVIVHEVPHHHDAPTQYKFLQVAIDEDHVDITQGLVGRLYKASGVGSG